MTSAHHLYVEPRHLRALANSLDHHATRACLPATTPQPSLAPGDPSADFQRSLAAALATVTDHSAVIADRLRTLAANAATFAYQVEDRDAAATSRLRGLLA